MHVYARHYAYYFLLILILTYWLHKYGCCSRVKTVESAKFLCSRWTSPAVPAAPNMPQTHNLKSNTCLENKHHMSRHRYQTSNRGNRSFACRTHLINYALLENFVARAINQLYAIIVTVGYNLIMASIRCSHRTYIYARTVFISQSRFHFHFKARYFFVSLDFGQNLGHYITLQQVLARCSEEMP